MKGGSFLVHFASQTAFEWVLFFSVASQADWWSSTGSMPAKFSECGFFEALWCRSYRSLAFAFFFFGWVGRRFLFPRPPPRFSEALGVTMQRLFLLGQCPEIHFLRIFRLASPPFEISPSKKKGGPFRDLSCLIAWVYLRFWCSDSLSPPFPFSSPLKFCIAHTLKNTFEHNTVVEREPLWTPTEYTMHCNVWVRVAKCQVI